MYMINKVYMVFTTICSFGGLGAYLLRIQTHVKVSVCVCICMYVHVCESVFISACLYLWSMLLELLLTKPF